MVGLKVSYVRCARCLGSAVYGVRHAAGRVRAVGYWEGGIPGGVLYRVLTQPYYPAVSLNRLPRAAAPLGLP